MRVDGKTVLSERVECARRWLGGKSDQGRKGVTQTHNLHTQTHPENENE